MSHPLVILDGVLEVLSHAVKEVMTFDVSSYVDDEVHDSLLGLRHQLDLLTAHESVLAAEWDRRRHWAADGSRSAGHRLSRETGSGIASSKYVILRAQRLSSMPLTLDAFLLGDLSADRVDELVKLFVPELRDLFLRDEELLVSYGRTMVWPDFVRVCHYWKAMADVEATRDANTRLINQRECYASKTVDGAVDIRALLDPVSGEIVLAALTAIEQGLFEADWAEARERLGEAATKEDLVRTNPQRRADALVEMAIRSQTAPKDGRRPAPLFTVLVGEDTLKQTCETATGTVLTPDQLVPHLGDSDIERIVFDGPKRVIEVGHQRRFRGALERAIKARDRRCQHSSVCDVPAHRCQCDHNEPWSKGGETIECNGQCLCPFHNHWKGDTSPEAVPDPDPPPDEP